MSKFLTLFRRGTLEWGFGLISVLFFNWWLPLLADENGNLPNWLKWFQTFDATLDAGWQDGYIDSTWGSTKFRRFLARVYWLYRNPSYGFDYWVLGEGFDPKQWTVVTYNPDGTKFYAIGPNGQFNWYGRIGFLRIKLGWKAWNYFQSLDANGNPIWNDKSWGPEWRVPFVVSITIWN